MNLNERGIEMTVSQFFQSCSTLPGSITSYHFNDNFLKEFQRLFRSKEAKNTSRVLYAFVCKGEMPRVKGKSNIIYIGHTMNSLEGRYWGCWTKGVWSRPNLEFCSYVIQNYGPINIAYLVMDTIESLETAEHDLLKDYYKLHMELPPRNSQGYGLGWNSWPG